MLSLLAKHAYISRLGGTMSYNDAEGNCFPNAAAQASQLLLSSVHVFLLRSIQVEKGDARLFTNCSRVIRTPRNAFVLVVCWAPLSQSRGTKNFSQGRMKKKT